MQPIKETQIAYNVSLPFDALLIQALRLPPLQKVQLVEKLMGVLGKELKLAATQLPPPRSLFGVLAHLGPAPSTEEIDEARREAWKNFPREDI